MTFLCCSIVISGAKTSLQTPDFRMSVDLTLNDATYAIVNSGNQPLNREASQNTVPIDNDALLRNYDINSRTESL